MLEWAEEGSLWEEVKPPNGAPAPLSLMRCRLVMSQLLLAVKVVHEAGYIHRDIKPHNILKARSGRSIICKLCDFGTALPKSQSPANEGEEGTPAYIPPERYWQFNSDTWQIGKCLLALRSGATPHMGAFEEVRDSGQYNSLEECLVEAEWDFLEKCLEANAGHRPDPWHLLESEGYPLSM
jgi:serine/threonine protein kinase